MKILVTSDSTCALDRQEAEKIGLPILPLNVIVNGVEYHDGIDINTDTLCKMMRDGAVIKTSTPTPYEIETFFDAQFAKGYDHIIHFTISSKLSSMFELFTSQCHEKYGDRVTVIDSLTVCQFMLDHVFTAMEMVKEGKGVEDIKEALKDRINTEDVRFIPESLTFLKNGGRISPTIAFVGNMIGLKPVLILKDGAIEKEGTTRNMKKTIDELLHKFENMNLDAKTWHIVILQFDTDEKMIEFVLARIKEVLPDFEAVLAPISINVCAHAGPGTIGVGISRIPTK